MKATARLIGSVRTLSDLRSFATPEVLPSKTRDVSYVPVPHDTVRDLTEKSLLANGFTILDEQIAVARDNQRAFGTFVVSNTDTASDWNLAVGWRNAHDKSSKAMIATGSRVVVCANMCIFAEHVLGRKHTTNIMAELPDLIDLAIKNEVMAHQRIQTEQFQAMKTRAITRDEAILTIVEAVETATSGPHYLKGCLSKGKVMDILGHWESSESTEQHGKDNAWSLWNAGTHYAKSRWAKNAYEASQELAIWQQVCAKRFAPVLATA
jgi:hypothetical protein